MFKTAVATAMAPFGATKLPDQPRMARGEVLAPSWPFPLCESASNRPILFDLLGGSMLTEDLKDDLERPWRS